MSVTNQFYIWFYGGLGGLGGWFLFFLLAAGAVIFLLYDTQKRRLPAGGWKLGVVLAACLLFPAIIFRFSSIETQLSLAGFSEMIFYLGLLGGILPPVLAVGYYVSYQGLVGCPQGHVYDAVLYECPECNRKHREPVFNEAGWNASKTDVYSDPPPRTRRNEPVESMRPTRARANAWLVAGNKNFQLYQGTTTIGRATRNDIVLDGDSTISKEHAKIIEENGRFRLYDLGSTNGTYLNDRFLRKPALIEMDDEIRFGDNILLRFMTSQG